MPHACGHPVNGAASYITGSAFMVEGCWTAIDGAPIGLTQTHLG